MSAEIKLPSAPHRQRILVIDDDPMVRGILRETLQKWGHDVTMAVGPLDGFGAYCRDKPDLVLLDFYMPDGGAPAFLREMVRTGQDAKVLVMSGSMQVGKALAETMPAQTTFLPKPFHQTDFDAAVARVSPAAIEKSNDGVVSALPVTKGIMADLNRRLRSGQTHLPPLDPALQQKVSRFRNPDLSIEDVVLAVRQDPALVAELIRTAHQAAQRTGRSVAHVRDAVVQLGNRDVAAMMQEVALRTSPAMNKSGVPELFDKMWVNANLCAHLTEKLAVALRHPRVQELRTVALLHNIGELLIVRLYSEALGDAPLSSADLLMIADQCTRNHERIGRRVFNRWTMPQEIRNLVGAHHLPSSSRECTQCQRMVLLAWKIALAAGAVYFPNHETELDLFAEAERMHMPQETLQGFLDEGKALLSKGFPNENTEDAQGEPSSAGNSKPSNVEAVSV